MLTLARRIRATELDDLQLESVTTPAAAVVPALLAARLCQPEDLFDCARPVLRDSPGFARVMRAVRVHDADWLAARHPESYPAQVEVTLADGEVVAFLSDGRSPAPTWDWDSVLGKAEAAASLTMRR